ncbi:hypothetical protein BH09BAC3_BH09BAC3_37390 [soil metagenome]
MTKEFKNEYRKKLALRSMEHDGLLDAKGFGDLYNKDATFQLGAMPIIVGNKNIEGFVAQFFSMGFKTISHEFKQVWDLDENLIFEAVATFHKLDGSHIRIPYVNVHTYANNLVQSTKIFMDSKPLG